MIYLTTQNHFFPLRFIEIFLPHSKPLIVGSIYCSFYQEISTEHFSKIKTNDTEIYISGDFLVLNQKCIFHQTNTQSMSHEVKNYFQFCSFLGLTQLIKSPTRVTCTTFFLIDQILITSLQRVS